MGKSKAPGKGWEVGVIGGGGHIGLPLALALSDGGHRTVIYDINEERVAKIRRGEMPFREDDAPEILTRVLANGMLGVESTPECLSTCRYLVMIVGTPVDEHLNPTFTAIQRAIDGCIEHLRDGQVMILRSTVFPGISEHIQRHLVERGLKIRVAFCPERVAQGHSLREFRELPQIISAFDPETLKEVRKLFSCFAKQFVELEPKEAELAKLMTNAWRYIQFATANQFHMLAWEHGLDGTRILDACRFDYPRTAGMPGAGFAAGPCLAKDTMQLAAFAQNQFILGHSAMLINEGLPYHAIRMAERKTDLSGKVVGILGMAFKAESDDPRDSLSYKLRKLLMLRAKAVLCTDPYVQEPDLLGLDEVLARADVLFVATPHKAYRGLKIPAGKVVIDIWGCTGK